jgi:hypothetical protein
MWHYLVVVIVLLNPLLLGNYIVSNFYKIIIFKYSISYASFKFIMSLILITILRKEYILISILQREFLYTDNLDLVSGSWNEGPACPFPGKSVYFPSCLTALNPTKWNAGSSRWMCVGE